MKGFLPTYWNNNDRLEGLSNGSPVGYERAFFQKCDNIIPAFESEFIAKNITSITSVELLKLKRSDCTQILSSTSLTTDFLRISQKNINFSTYSSISNVTDYLTNEIDTTFGLYQLRITANTGDILYSDVFSMIGVPVPKFSCSNAEIIDNIFYIDIERIDSETIDGLGILYVYFRNKTTNETVIKQINVSLNVGETQTYSITTAFIDNYSAEWAGICTDNLTFFTCDNGTITLDNDILTLDTINY